MIKTVSFSPSRSSSRPTTPRSNSRAATKTASTTLKPEPVIKKDKPQEKKTAPKQPKLIVQEEVQVADSAEAPAPKPKAAPKAKKMRAPANLAEQYGLNPSRRAEKAPAIEEEDSPKKRLTKAEREARRALMRPDEGLLQRLQRAEIVPTRKKQPRPRGWRFECGCCGRVTHFQTPAAALCACGAIAVKE